MLLKLPRSTLSSSLEYSFQRYCAARADFLQLLLADSADTAAFLCPRHECDPWIHALPRTRARFARLLLVDGVPSPFAVAVDPRMRDDAGVKVSPRCSAVGRRTTRRGANKRDGTSFGELPIVRQSDIRSVRRTRGRVFLSPRLRKQPCDASN